MLFVEIYSDKQIELNISFDLVNLSKHWGRVSSPPPPPPPNFADDIFKFILVNEK